MQLKEIETAVRELLALGELRSQLERAPNGNIKDSLKSAIDGMINSHNHYGEIIPTGDISIIPSGIQAFKGCFVVYLSKPQIRLLIRIVGPCLEISSDLNSKSPENCVWIKSQETKKAT